MEMKTNFKETCKLYSSKINSQKELIINTTKGIEFIMEDYINASMEYASKQKEKKAQLKDSIQFGNDRITSLTDTLNSKDNENRVLSNEIIDLKDRLYKSELIEKSLNGRIRSQEIIHIQEVCKERESKEEKERIIEYKESIIGEMALRESTLRKLALSSLKYLKHEIAGTKSSLLLTTMKSRELVTEFINFQQNFKSIFAEELMKVNSTISFQKQRIYNLNKAIDETIESEKKLKSELDQTYDDLEYNKSQWNSTQKRLEESEINSKQFTQKFENRNSEFLELKSKYDKLFILNSQEKSNYESHIKELKAKLLAADHKIAFSTTEADRLREIESQLKNDYEELQKEYLDYKDKSQFEYESLSIEIEQYRTMHFKNSDLETKFHAERSSMEADIIQLRQKLKEANQVIVSLKEEIERADSQHKERMRDIQEWKGSQMNGISAKELEKLKDYDSLKSENFSLKEKCLNLSSSNNKLSSELSSNQKELEFKLEEIANFRDFIEQLKNDSGKGSEITVHQRLQIKDLQEQVNSMKVTIMLNSESILNLESENSELRKKNNFLNEQKYEVELSNRQMEENYKASLNELQDSLGKYKEALLKINSNVNGYTTITTSMRSSINQTPK